MKIALLNCTKTKKPYKCKAEEMYSDSQLFMVAKRFAEQRLGVDRICILSCKYGLLDMDTIIEPYNVTLQGSKKEEQAEFGLRVYKQLQSQEWFKDLKEIQFLTSEPYHWCLIELLRDHNIYTHIHGAGLGMGYKIQYFRNQVSRQKKLFNATKEEKK